LALSVLRSVVNISEKSKQKAEETLFSVEQISGAIDEIAKGASQQAVEVRTRRYQKIRKASPLKSGYYLKTLMGLLMIRRK